MTCPLSWKLPCRGRHTDSAFMQLRNARRIIRLEVVYRTNDSETRRQLTTSKMVTSLLSRSSNFNHLRNAYVEDLKLCYDAVSSGRKHLTDSATRFSSRPSIPSWLWSSNHVVRKVAQPLRGLQDWNVRVIHICERGMKPESWLYLVFSESINRRNK